MEEAVDDPIGPPYIPVSCNIEHVNLRNCLHNERFTIRGIRMIDGHDPDPLIPCKGSLTLAAIVFSKYIWTKTLAIGLLQSPKATEHTSKIT